jgi:hypothetical protein
MGGGCSTHVKTPAEREAARRKREQRAAARLKRKEYKQVKADALKRERDSWLRNYSARLEKQWWHVGWWPIYEWWSERNAWEVELYRRKKEGLLDAEGVPLRSHHD